MRCVVVVKWGKSHAGAWTSGTCKGCLSAHGALDLAGHLKSQMQGQYYLPAQ